MKKFKIKKETLNILSAIGAIIFLIVLVNFYSGRDNEKVDQSNEKADRLDVEIIEESENIDEVLEDEIEGYIEDDISDLEIKEEESEDIEDDQVVASDSAEVAVLPIFQREKRDNELRIGFMTDIHAKSNAGASRSDRVIKPIFKERINYFIEKMNNEFIPNFILLNGDVIEGTGRDNIVGMGELVSVKRLFNRTQIPKYWVAGNHDLRPVNKDGWKKALEIDYMDKSFDVGDYRIIILDSNYDDEGNHVDPENYYTRGSITKKQLEWVENELKTDKKKIVFIHNPPLWDVDVRSNSGLPKNALEIQKVFSQNNVMAVFSGHIEDFFYDKIDGVKYFVLPGVIKSEKYQGTFAEIEIIDDKIEMDVSYVGNNGKYRKINIKEIVK